MLWGVIISIVLATPPIQRLQQSLQSLKQNYWQTYPDPNSTIPIGFFFSCGQIGHAGPNSTAHTCRCDHSAQCENCYRWWDGLAMELMANEGIATNSDENKGRSYEIWRHSPYNSRWSGQCQYIDDFSWYTLGYIRTYEWLGEPLYRREAISLFNWTWAKGWDHTGCGGMYWNTCMGSKNSITLMEMLNSAARLAYLEKKEGWSPTLNFTQISLKILRWFESYPNHGIYDERGVIADGVAPDDGFSQQCCNFTHTAVNKSKCILNEGRGYSYNQGLYLSSMAFLFNVTGDASFREKGIKLLNKVLTHYTNADGVFIDDPPNYPTYYDTCEFDQDPGGDWYSFKGVLVTHLSYFYEHMPLPENLKDRIYEHIKNSSDALWENSVNAKRDDDLCFKRVTNSTKKFHWDWTFNSKPKPEPPQPKPDTGEFFVLPGRCYSTSSDDYASFMEDSQENCEARARNDTNATKYVYCTDCSEQGWEQNCWLFTADRNAYYCDFTADDYDNDYVVGAKRPSNSTCSVCDEDPPDCRCDADCTSFMDCCLNYGEKCGVETVTCRNQCDSAAPVPIPGGGYCMCYMNYYDPDPSDDSFCPDYKAECEDPPDYDYLCLDARSQISATSLFYAHTKLDQLRRKLTRIIDPRGNQHSF